MPEWVQNGIIPGSIGSSFRDPFAIIVGFIFMSFCGIHFDVNPGSLDVLWGVVLMYFRDTIGVHSEYIL